MKKWNSKIVWRPTQCVISHPWFYGARPGVNFLSILPNRTTTLVLNCNGWQSHALLVTHQGFYLEPAEGFALYYIPF